MSEYTRAEIIAQIIAAAVQAFDEEDGVSRSVVVDLAIKHADYLNLIHVALICGHAIREYDEHLRDEHDQHLDQTALIRAAWPRTSTVPCGKSSAKPRQRTAPTRIPGRGGSSLSGDPRAR